MRGRRCPTGCECEVVVLDHCTAPCPAPPGETPNCESICELTSYETCRPAPCDTESDCGENMKCHTFVRNVTPASCPPGVSCGGAAPPEPQEHRKCTPRSFLPCETSTDCGDGYECVPTYQCSCEGSAPQGTPGEEAPAVGAPTAPTFFDAGAGPTTESVPTPNLAPSPP